MRIDVSIADTVVGWIGFITLGRALHADAGESFHGRLRHNGFGSLGRLLMELCSWVTMAWNSFTSVGHMSIWTASNSLPRNPRRTVIKIVQGMNL
jgi:hypothetical protein